MSGLGTPWRPSSRPPRERWLRVGELDRLLMGHSLRIRSPRRDRILVGVSRAANYSRLWLAIAAALAAFGGRRGRRAAETGVLAIAIAAAAANGPAKLLVRRRRPSSLESALIRMPRSTSFPSGHSAAAFAFATGSSIELPAVAPAVAPLAGAVAYSRVHTGVHYPSDVAGGIGIGIAAGVLAARLRGGTTRWREPEPE